MSNTPKERTRLYRIIYKDFSDNKRHSKLPLTVVELNEVLNSILNRTDVDQASIKIDHEQPAHLNQPPTEDKQPGGTVEEAALKQMSDTKIADTECSFFLAGAKFGANWSVDEAIKIIKDNFCTTVGERENVITQIRNLTGRE